jgi:hypothetical protein
MLDRALALAMRATNRAAAGLARSSHKLMLLRARRAYQGFEDDIFIVSYPKSGTTWIQMILHQIMSDGAMNIPHIDIVAPHFEETLLPFGRTIDELSRPRVVKSHLSYQQIPKGPGRYIYALRDGRDVAVSYFHQFSHLYKDTFDRFFDDFMRGKLPYGSWFSHVAEWTDNRNDLNMLIVKFEELASNLPAAIRRIAAFCNIKLDERQFPRILGNCTFTTMRRYEAKFSLATRFTAQLIERPVPMMIRKGRVGEWRNNLTADMLKGYYSTFNQHLTKPLFSEYKP